MKVYVDSKIYCSTKMFFFFKLKMDLRSSSLLCDMFLFASELMKLDFEKGWIENNAGK